MSCSSCKYLKTDKNITGCSGGCKYYCEKNKDYVVGNDCCNNYCSSTRSNYLCNKIYNEGREYNDDSKSPSDYMFILVLLLIVLFILKIFNLA